MPLPDASADAVFVSTAWHWLDLPRAVPEIARVLRPGGRLGVIWTSRDRNEDWVAELDLLRLDGADLVDRPRGEDDEPQTLAEVRAQLERHHSVLLPAGSAFGPGESASFRFARTMSAGDVLAWLATNSAFITASAAEREAGLARCREAVLSRVGTESVIEMPMRSWCWRADRS
jgi:SAM-dependent methyltransferase